MKAKRIEGMAKVPVAIPTLDGSGIAETVTIEVPCLVDAKTGEEFLSGEALAEIDRVKARHMGLLQPEEIRSLRYCLGLTQKGMSELLQIGAKSYTRWESGRERPSRSLNILLRALRDGKLDVGYLRAIQSADFNWRPAMEAASVVQMPTPYNVNVDMEEEACDATERPAA
jgi:DNA-binding transcriptional regulator YiaG